MDPSKDKKSKWRLPGLSKSSPSHPPSEAIDPSRNSTHDSTYSSTPSLTGSDASRAPHGGQPISQESYRNDQGQTVTTTTTTTTTTVVTSGPDGHTSVTQHDPGATSTNTNSGGGGSMESLRDRISDKFRGVTNTNASTHEKERGGYRDEGSGMGHAGPQVPIKSSMRERSPNPQPPRSPTGGSNFSYPSRTPPPQGQGYAPPGMGPTATAGNAGVNAKAGSGGGGTLQGLKSAALGLHGVGETLRGTVNSSVDRRFKASPETIAAHEQVVRTGQEEMNSGRRSEAPRQEGGHAGGQAGGHREGKGILKSVVGRDPSGRLRVVNE